MTDVKFSMTELPVDKGLEQRIKDATFKAAVRIMNKWIDNLETGSGALGSHGGPYVSTGEAVASIRLDPETPDSDTYTIFSDKIQVLIAEVGRMPGTMPPFEPISQWVHEKLGVKKGSKGHYPIVQKIRQNIKENGLEPFAPMEKAVVEVVHDLEKELGRAVEPQ